MRALSFDEAEALAALIYDDAFACQQIIREQTPDQHALFQREYQACIRAGRGARYAWTFAVFTASWLPES